MKYKDWDECIHIHACRRLTKIANNALFGKGKKGKLTRMCGKDRCDCFQSKDEIKETSRLVCELKDRIKWIRDEGGEMGNYNCQECIAKEANYINELLLDANILSPEESSIEETKTLDSKIKPKKKSKSNPSQEDLKQLLESKDLSKEQKKFVEKIIKKNSCDLYLEQNEKKEEQKKLKEKKEQKQNDNKKNNNSNIPEVTITTLNPLENKKEEIINNEAIIIENEDINENESMVEEEFQESQIEIKKDENNMDYLFEKNNRKEEPQDFTREDFRKPIIPKRNNNIVDEIKPRDSLRKKQSNITNNNKIPLNRGEEQNMKQINYNENNININQNEEYYTPVYNKEQNVSPENNNIEYNNMDNNELYQEFSQREMEMTISDRENPLLNDNVGNMNYLEKQYEAYKNKMRQFYDE